MLSNVLFEAAGFNTIKARDSHSAIPKLLYHCSSDACPAALSIDQVDQFRLSSLYAMLGLSGRVQRFASQMASFVLTLGLGIEVTNSFLEVFSNCNKKSLF